MIKVAFDPSFKRALRRKLASDPEREKRFRERLKRFIEDPFDPALRAHKLSGQLKDIGVLRSNTSCALSFISPIQTALCLSITHREVY